MIEITCNGINGNAYAIACRLQKGTPRSSGFIACSGFVAQFHAEQAASPMMADPAGKRRNR